MEKNCSKCVARKPLTDFYRDGRALDGRDSCCKTCHNTMCNKYRKDNIEKYRGYENNHPRRKKAKSYILTAIRGGHIKRGKKCETCGSKEKLHGHHDDYAKVLDVRWLCRTCHAE